MSRNIVRVGILLILALAVGVLPLSAQELRLEGLGGEALREADLDGKRTIIVFWASWSPRGRDVVDRVNGIADQWAGKARVITVNFQEDPATVRQFLAGKGLKVPVFLDADASFSKKYSRPDLPALVVLDGRKPLLKVRMPADPNAELSRVLG
ncbi:MAG: TlpA disulfide reductase family protein [Acidobacteriota bacterium]